MKRGFLNSKRIKQQPLYEGGSDAPVTVKEGAEDPSRYRSIHGHTNLTRSFSDSKVSVEGTKGICEAFSEIQI